MRRDACHVRVDVRTTPTSLRCAWQALVDGRVLCVHGGLSPDLRTLDQVRARCCCTHLRPGTAGFGR